jgi:HD-GYP domain-containing protein (c-di-GMP phosphodiesterase class II)
VRGAWLLGQVPWLEPAAAVVRWHHQPWFQTGASVLTTDARASQILQLADTLERAIDRSRGILEQADDIRNGLLRLSGRELHPEIAACIRPVTESEAFWFDLTSPHLPQMLAHDSPLSDVRVDRAGFAALAGLLHRIVDFRSHFTATHSAGVAAAARALAAEMGLTTVEQSELALAGELHDLGKLAVPNGILEKPAALTSGERGVVRQHTYHTYTVLRQVAGMEALAESAAFHHERLDGTGYPFRLKAGALTTPARIMAVADTFTALAEDRPYRRPMEDTAVRNLLGQQVRAGAISREIVAVACDRFGALRSAMAAAQAVSQASYAQLTA